MSNLLHIYTVENPKELTFLRKVSKDIPKEEILSKQFQSFLDDLIYTSKTIVTEEGYTASGLSAIQVGKDLNVFCIQNEYDYDFEIMINPQIDIVKPTQTIEKEGCLSIPNKEGRVARFKKIKVTYLDRKGNRKRKTFKDLEAREIQHEYDHTKGVLFTDKLED
jgi:peptide deformylase